MQIPTSAAEMTSWKSKSKPGDFILMSEVLGVLMTLFIAFNGKYGVTESGKL
jgi:hypothetical protein